jgi:hypothetical protein
VVLNNNILGRFAVCIFFLFISGSIAAQTKYYTKSGVIDFEASVPSFEEVKARNETVTSILNINTGEIAALALVKGFRFKVALMEEHFNENYAESRNFPKATFSGIIESFSLEKLGTNPIPFDLNGKLVFHGKTVAIAEEALISLEGNVIQLFSNFILKPADFDIKIPKIVRNKVAETVTVHLNFKLIPK